MAIVEAVDYSQDIATLLRLGTAAAHDKAEHSELQRAKERLDNIA